MIFLAAFNAYYLYNEQKNVVFSPKHNIGGIEYNVIGTHPSI